MTSRRCETCNGGGRLGVFTCKPCEGIGWIGPHPLQLWIVRAWIVVMVAAGAFEALEVLGCCP